MVYTLGFYYSLYSGGVQVQAESIVFYKTFYDALISDLSAEDFLPPGQEHTAEQRRVAELEVAASRWEAVAAIFDYCFYDKDPEEIFGQLDGLPRAVFRIAKPLLDSNHARREGGKRGGRPRKSPDRKKPVDDGGYIGADGKYHTF